MYKAILLVSLMFSTSIKGEIYNDCKKHVAEEKIKLTNKINFNLLVKQLDENILFFEQAKGKTASEIGQMIAINSTAYALGIYSLLESEKIEPSVRQNLLNSLIRYKKYTKENPQIIIKEYLSVDVEKMLESLGHSEAPPI